MTASRAAGKVKSYSLLTDPVQGDTGTGLDQLVQFIQADPGLAGRIDGREIAQGAAAANRMNQLIVEAATATGAAADGQFTADEVVAMNAYIRANHLADWTALHGDDENGTETGFHLVQDDGATTRYRGSNLVDTVADGLYHLGFEIDANGNFLNEDGNANASVKQVAQWLTQFYADHSTTSTGLDRIVDLIMADKGLDRRISDADIAGGADAANGMNQIIVAAIDSTGVLADGLISVDDVRALNAFIRSDAARLAQWTELHGDDEGGSETGFHLVQNDGARTRMFGENLVDTVADGIYHLGFEIRGCRLLNEDGDANAKLGDVADWLNYFYVDQSTTNTGLDVIVDMIKTDRGLARNTDAGDIVGGAAAANSMNQIVVDLLGGTDALADGWITAEDLREMNAAIRADATLLARWTELHGDDEGGSETGFHLIQNDGASTTFFGKNLVDTIADGIYHLGFEIKGDRFLNEDGNANARLEDVATWLNFFYKQTGLLAGDGGSNTIDGTDAKEQINAGGGNDTVRAGGGDDLVYGGSGRDSIDGGAGDDIVYAGDGNDAVSGGDGDDVFRVSGAACKRSEGFDTYDGGAGTDVIAAIGAAVDIGVRGFSAGNGIEIIDATGATGPVRLVGDGGANLLDLSGVQFVGKVEVDGGGGADTIVGTAGDDTLRGGYGNDRIDGGAGLDTLFGGHGRDVFDFNGDWGQDVIADYRDGVDKLDFAGTGATRFEELGIAVVGNDVVITYGVDQVVLSNTNLASVEATDFVF
jgi:Ca2+-binding RTX toxin-like protein